ncbi:hypothetical protein SBC1_31310 [Caballeronia sp. SBC1]|uniref:hypothetical protein n=1 Tax=Caballeronia sp. SBC1 TaxID=2705548 RepID=UPI00140D3249|nr:hypothetical protein [Caballeronia sp. SBC1]QIN63107.1 hypothetical protein SBC1_31310 [Caballeronia sp. SBC1]
MKAREIDLVKWQAIRVEDARADAKMYPLVKGVCQLFGCKLRHRTKDGKWFVSGGSFPPSPILNLSIVITELLRNTSNDHPYYPLLCAVRDTLCSEFMEAQRLNTALILETRERWKQQDAEAVELPDSVRALFKRPT